MRKIIISLLLVFGVLFSRSVFAEKKCEFKQMSGDYNNIYSLGVSRGLTFLTEKEGKTHMIRMDYKGEFGYAFEDISFDKKSFILGYNNKDYFILDNGKVRTLKEDINGSINYSLENKLFKFVKHKNDTFTVTLNGKEKTFKKGKLEYIYYSNRGNTYVLFLNINDNISLYKDGKKLSSNNIKISPKLGHSIFSPNGKVFYFVIKDNEKLHIARFTCNSRENLLIKQLVVSKHRLQKNIRYKKFVEKFERIIVRISDKKLLNLDKKISKLSDKVRNSFKYKDILNYLEAKTKLEILKRRNNNGYDAYLKDENGNYNVYLEKDGKKEKVFSQIKKDGDFNYKVTNLKLLNDNILYYNVDLWEGRLSYFYNIKEKKFIKIEKGDYDGIVKNNKYIYSCKSAGMSGGHFKIYDTKSFDII